MTAIWVDDGPILSTHEFLVEKFFEKLNKEFEAKINKNITHYPGLEITKVNDKSAKICGKIFAKI